MNGYTTDFMKYYFTLVEYAENDELRMRLEKTNSLEERFITVANLPRSMLDKTDWEFCKEKLAIEPSNAEPLGKIDKYLSSLEKARNKGIGLYIYGPHGVFKTTLSVIIGLSALKDSYSVHFCPISQLVEFVRAGWKVPEIKSMWHYITNEVDFLIVDDLARDLTLNDSQRSIIDNLFVSRTNSGKPVIFTSNHDFEEVDKFMGPALRSMFMQHLIDVPLVGDDFRKEISENLINEL